MNLTRLFVQATCLVHKGNISEPDHLFAHAFKLKRFILVALMALSMVSTSMAQTQLTSSSCNCIKPLFDYLLQSNRLKIVQSQNITVQSLVNDANSAGFPVNDLSCPVLANNLNRLFYSLTPQYVNIDSFIVSPEGGIYQAMVGNCLMTFTATSGFFENKLNSFYAKNCTSPNSIAYAIKTPPTSCPRYGIRHYSGNDSLDWHVNYIDCFGNKQISMFTAKDTFFEFCATSIDLIQDIDLNRNAYSASWYYLTEDSNYTCAFNVANYNSPTVAMLEIQPCVNREEIVKNNPITVKAVPNPSTNNFVLNINSNLTTPVKLTVSDAFGRIVEMRTEVPLKGMINLGSTFRAGIYYVEIRQGNNVATTKLVKL